MYLAAQHLTGSGAGYPPMALAGLAPQNVPVIRPNQGPAGPGSSRGASSSSSGVPYRSPYACRNENSSHREWENEMSRVKIEKDMLNKILMKYLVAQAHTDVLQVFEKEAGIPCGVPLESVAFRAEIKQDVQEGKIEEAISKVNNWNETLLGNNPVVMFRLQQQRFIELVRDGNAKDALIFAEENLASLADQHQNTLIPLLEDTMPLLIWNDPKDSPSKHLLSQAYRKETAQMLNDTILNAQLNSEEPAELPLLFQLAHWSQAKLNERSPGFPQMLDFATSKLSSAPH